MIPNPSLDYFGVSTLFLIFGQNESRCSYKIVLIKKKTVYLHGDKTDDTASLAAKNVQKTGKNMKLPCS